MGQPTFDARVHTAEDQAIGNDRSKVCRAVSGIKRRYEIPEYIGGFKATQGTETSQYLEERISTETPLVVASERGPGQ
jgi:hypothetical protein